MSDYGEDALRTAQNVLATSMDVTTKGRKLAYARDQAHATAAVALAILNLADAVREAAPVKPTDVMGITYNKRSPCVHELDPLSTTRACRHCGTPMPL